jgi:ABC-type transporter Mla maintaining outer membrane lipid asymmetry permease subunit MlaE
LRAHGEVDVCAAFRISRIRAAVGRHRFEIPAIGCLGWRGHGVVLSLQTRDILTRFGAKSMLPAVIAFSLIRETGPIITA